MPTPIDVETAIKWTGGGAVFATLLGLVVKFLMKTFRTDRLESASTDADLNSYKRLQDEIVRLEKIIAVQQARTDELESRMNSLRDLELDGVVDIAMLAAILAQMPCGACVIDTTIFKQAQDIMKRIIDRRIEKQALMKGEVHVPVNP